MKFIIMTVSMVLLATGVWAAKQYRNFTNTDGQTIRGAVLAYDASTKTVTIERDNRRTAKVPITLFCEEDQVYILEWDAAKAFMSDSALKINCSRKRQNERKEEEWGKVSTGDGAPEDILLMVSHFESIVFEVELYNREENDLKDLRMEYVVYYEQSEVSWDKPVTEQKHYFGKMDIPFVFSRKGVTVSTDPVEIYADKVNQMSWTSGETRTGGKGEVHGVRARVYMRMPSGSEVMREFAYPEKLSMKKYPWKN